MTAHPRLAFRLPPLILATWGMLLLYLAASGHLRTLLNPLFWPLEIGAGIVLMLFAAVYLRWFRPVAAGLGAMVRHKMVWQAGALLIPFSIAALNAPTSLSAAALQARSALSGGKILAQMGASSTVSDSPSLIDFATAAYYPEHIPSVTGRQVSYLGQYLPGDAPGEFRFCRVLISCCAADATPIYLHIVGPVPLVSEMQWITVKGSTFFRENSDGDEEPCLHLSSVTPASPPPDPYLYAIRMGKPAPQ
jgi:uncharacterized repeat protein (TIGR03943 family)